MKVAIIGMRGYPSYYGGFETAVRKIAPFLAAKGWKVSVYGRRSAVRLDDTERDTRVESLLTPGIDSNSLSTLSYGFTSCVHAFFHKPDVALVMNVANGYWLPILKLRGIPTVVNVDGIEWQRAKWGRLAKAVFLWGARFTAKFADHLVFDAKAIEDIWIREFGRSGTFIPYGGDSVAEVLPVEPGLESRSYALMVARFVPENTVSEFVEAAEDISQEFDVVLVGSAPEGSPLFVEVSDLARRNSRVHWLGHISDDQRLHALWQHAGAYFHGHSVGGTNPALVQAMALGSPVVARDTVFNREVLDDAGTYVQPDAESIASGVKAMIRKGQTFGPLAVDRAASAYSWLDVCERYALILETASKSAHSGATRSA